MNQVPHPDPIDALDERTSTLLCDRALWGLDDDEERWVSAVLGGENGGEIGLDVFDRSVATLSVAMQPLEPMPGDLAQRIRSLWSQAMTDEDAEADTLEGEPAPLRLAGHQPDAPPRPTAWLGWIAAAACLVFAVVASRPAADRVVPELSVGERLAALEEGAPDLIQASWAGISAIGAPDHALDRGVTGEVIWSDDRDEGFMRIAGIESNDPGEFQYQLWIFDADRRTGDLPQFRSEGLPEVLTQRPVDGGVFDVGPGGEVLVPIDAKLPVGRGVLFAVTKEPPGGVVVSDRDIVFLALRG